MVKAINAKGFAHLTVGQINRLTEVAQEHGAKGLAFIKAEDGQWKSPIVKFFADEEKAQLTEKMNVEEGDLILFGAGPWEQVCEVLGRVRLEAAAMTNELQGKENEYHFLWVTDFPLLGYDEDEQKWNAVHHPFTRPKEEDLELLKAGEYGKVRAEAYDVVLNGHELGGGSIRIHEKELHVAHVHRSRRGPRKNRKRCSGIYWMPFSSALPHTEESPWVSTALSCLPAANTASVRSLPFPRTTKASTS